MQGQQEEEPATEGHESPLKSRPLLYDHPLSRRIDPNHVRWPLLLLLICSLLSFWSWQPGNRGDFAATRALVFDSYEYWRIPLSVFVHADIAHLLANTGLFLVFGVLLRNYFGWVMFPVLSLLGAWLTEILALLTYDANVRLIGASGMVYFMAGLWLLLFARYADYLSVLHRGMRMLAFILVVLLPTQIEAQVSYRSHAIGLGLGLVFAWLALPWIRPIPMSAAEREERQHLKPLPDEDDDDVLVDQPRGPLH